jgi:hypothetical protein
MNSKERARFAQDLAILAASEPDQHTFAILDAARSTSVFPAIEALAARRSSLLAETIAPELERASPFLVDIGPGDPLLETVLGEGWGDHWGVLLTSAYEHDFLVPHLRDIVRARTEDGADYFFRFYDPRVLRLYLPTCTAAELDTFFGPIARFLVEGQAGEPPVIEYILREGALVSRRFEVTAA